MLRQHGFTHAMVVAGGEIGLGDPPPNKPGWLIGIAPLESACSTQTPPLAVPSVGLHVG